MSGGSDSTAAALILKEQGCKIFGVTAVMIEDLKNGILPENAARARRQAEKIGVDHHVVQVQYAFKESVIKPFATSYITGTTPSPCVLCNSLIKFGVLSKEVFKLGGNKIATGHYARLIKDAKGTLCLARGADKEKDQSYFLAMVAQDDLDRALFPLGDFTKRDVKKLLAAKGIENIQGKESQDICFIGERLHGQWIEEELKVKQRVGRIMDTAGREIGTHKGIHHYTIGQRKGLRVSGKEPLYVVKIDAVRNEVVLGNRQEAMGKTMRLTGVNWYGTVQKSSPINYGIQIRYRHKPALGEVTPLDKEKAGVSFAEPQFGITPGQLAVFYEEDQVFGGGWIESWA